MGLPFYFSAINDSIARSSVEDTLNILYNERMQNIRSKQSLFYVPTFSSSYYDLTPTCSLPFPDPIAAAQQAIMDFRNGRWLNQGGYGIGSGNNGGNYSAPWNWDFSRIGQNNNNGNGNGNGNGGNGGSGNTAQSTEYNALRALLVKYKDMEKNSTVIDKINEALNNNSNKPEEKLQALKDVYKTLNSEKLKKALLSLDDVKTTLEAIGYNLKGLNKNSDRALSADLLSLEDDIKAAKGDRLAIEFNTDNDAEILRKISMWNDSHSGDGSRSIIRLVANNLPAKKSTNGENVDNEPVLHIQGVSNMVLSLVNVANELKAEIEGSTPNLDAAKDEVLDALKSAKDSFTKPKLITLANKFDNLYAIIRMMEAQKVRNELKDKYGFINNISSSDKDFINDSFIVEETKADLEAEGIKVIPAVDEIEYASDDIENDGDDDGDDDDLTPQEAVTSLVNSGDLSKEGNYYVSKASSTDEPAHVYTIEDDKLVELKDVVSVDDDGTCTMKDGSTKSLDEVTKVEVKKGDIVTYNKTLTRIEKLIDSGKIKQCSTIPANAEGTVLYQSTAKNSDGHYQYFIVRNNKLMLCNCDYIDTNGKFVKDNKGYTFDKLTDNDFSTISDSDIVSKAARATQPDGEEPDKENGSEEDDNEIEALIEQGYNPPELDQAAYDRGKKIATDLMGNTTDSEWTRASSDIMRIDSENVYSVIKAYAEEQGGGTDHILEQIATEKNCRGWTACWGEWLRGRRSAADRLKLINHIVKAVLEHCDKYGIAYEYSYTKLKEKYNNGNGITEDDINKNETTVIRELDHYILDLLNLSDKY